MHVCILSGKRLTKTAVVSLMMVALITLLLYRPVAADSSSTGDPILVGAGDIASCALNGDEQTALLLDQLPGTVFTAGDNAYPNGSPIDFQECYGHSWGRHKARTRPSPGNHDYVMSYADPYFAYFGKNAGPARRGYYSYNLGAWHIISLNSDIAANPGSAQEQWLRADLKANPTVCTLAYWHHPLFSSGLEPDLPRDVITLWRVLYEYGADVVINGHVHLYERFMPLNPDGWSDPSRGIREFIVGTGGASLNRFPIFRLPISEVESASSWGVIKLTLHPNSYDWQFIPVAGSLFTDSGRARCTDPFVF